MRQKQKYNLVLLIVYVEIKESILVWGGVRTPTGIDPESFPGVRVLVNNLPAMGVGTFDCKEDI